jgi:hypothetical protein
MSGSLARREEALAFERTDAFGIRGARWTATGLELPPDLKFSDYEHVLWALGRLRDMSAWALGDAIIFGDAAYGEKYAQAIEATGRAKATLVNYASVARRVPPSRRRARLSFSAHEAVASMNPDEQNAWLARAEDERLSVEELRGLVRDSRNITTSGGLPASTDCQAALRAAVDALHEPVFACYGDVPFEVVVEPIPGAEVRIRPEGGK